MLNNMQRFQGWLAFLTSLLLLGVLATGVVIALIRLIQYAWSLVS